jgi:TonB-dependent starch-binding outer membrane protein SusC
MDQKGVAIANGLQRLQGRLNGTHSTFENRLRLNINLTASQVRNDYLPFESSGGFEGGVFQNAVIFNPTQPVMTTHPVTQLPVFYEAGTGRQSVRNPVAMANQIADEGRTSRILGNALAEFDIQRIPGLTASLNIGADRSEGIRQTYMPKASPVGAEWNGRARQATKENESLTLQTLLNYRRELTNEHHFDAVAGYEYSEYDNNEYWIDVRTSSPTTSASTTSAHRTRATARRSRGPRTAGSSPSSAARITASRIATS